jgi:hypothetical protein
VTFLALWEPAKPHDGTPGTDALHNAVKHPALARGISAFEHKYDLGPSASYPLLHLHQFSLKLAEFAFVFFGLEFVFLLEAPLFPFFLCGTCSYQCSTAKSNNNVSSLQVIALVR